MFERHPSDMMLSKDIDALRQEIQAIQTRLDQQQAVIQVLFNIVKNAVEAKPDARILLKTSFSKGT